MNLKLYASIVRAFENERKIAADYARACSDSKQEHRIAQERVNGIDCARQAFENVVSRYLHETDTPPRSRMDVLPSTPEHKALRNVWRLEFHERFGLHWNLNDEDPPNTAGFRTVLTCTDDEHDNVTEKVDAIWEALMRENGRVDYYELYKAMNA